MTATRNGDEASLQDKLDAWVAAELIDTDQAEALLVYEMQRAPVRTSRVPLAAEAVGYIGSGLVFAAAALLIGNRWDSMSTPGRIASLAAPTIVAAVAGWWTGRSDEPALQRLGSVLWLLAVAGVAGLAGEVWVDAIHDGDPPDHHAALFLGSITLGAAVPAWWARRVALQQVALLGATIATSLGVLDTIAAVGDRSLSAVSAGVVLATLGASWVAAGLADRLPPALLANVMGSALILVAAQVVRADNDHLGLWLGLVASIALMATGVTRAELAILFVGALGLFQWTPQIALFYLEDSLGAEATLFVIGALFIVLAGLLTRMYPWVKARRGDRGARPDETPTEPPKFAERDGERRSVPPLVVGISVVALVLVALLSQWFGSSESDRRGTVLDDRGPVQDEEWSITRDDGAVDIHTVVMIKTFNSLEAHDIEELGGRLVWEETEIELCTIGIRSAGDGFVQIGDIFRTDDQCDPDTGMQQAVDEFGPPETACVFLRAVGVDDEYCAPLVVG